MLLSLYNPLGLYTLVDGQFSFSSELSGKQIAKDELGTPDLCG